MGRKGGHRGKRQRLDKAPQGSAGGYSDVVQENELFERFYKELEVIPDADWDAYRAAIRRRLPTTFRVTGTRSHAKCVQHVLETQYFPKLESIEIDGEEYDKPAAMPWYPDGMAYHCEFGRQLVRRSPQLASFHKFLVNESERGNISRQEAVSMIPPLLLDVQPGHCVLDMCAAPGSKTAQIIEMLQRDESSSGVPEGLVVANDADSKRSYMLVHQAKRLHSPCFLVTNDDATRFPGLRRDGDEPLMFDRVLCDVPCSGDGTVRKNPLIWKSWTPYLGPSQHVLQTRILARGLQLLRVGGTLVYSTCSMHPAENEAVVADALRRLKGQVELVDVSDKLPGLVRSAGLAQWKLMGKVEQQWQWFERYDDVPESLHARLKDSMFARDDCRDMNLDRCMRVYAHQQDTGGFFIAVLRKTAPITRAEQLAAEPDPKIKTKKRNAYQSEEPFVFFQNDQVMAELKEYYGLREDFPYDQLITRTETGKVRHLYLVSKHAATLLRHNHGIKIVNTGVRAFTRVDGVGVDCSFRPAQEALDCVVPYFTKRVFTASYDDVCTLLKQETIDISELSAGMEQAIQDHGPGPAVLVHEPTGEASLSRSTVRVCAWIGKKGARLLVTKEDAFSILLRLAGPEVAEQAFADRQKRQAQASGKAEDGKGSEEAAEPPCKRPAEDTESESGDGGAAADVANE